MPALPLSSLDSRTLARRLGELAGDERRVQVEFLLHLDEFDRRRAWLELGHGSLWTYCLEVLHLREGSAGRRIGAMKVLRRFPRLAEALGDGRLCLTTLAQLGQVLTEENAEDLLARAAFRTTAEVDHLVASTRPRPVPREGIRRLPRAAVTGRVSESVFLGIETRYERGHEDLAVGHLAGWALFVGPTLYARLGDTAFLSVAWNTQVAGHTSGENLRLDLDNFERNRVMVRFAADSATREKRRRRCV